jgi:membrane protein
MLTFGKLLSTPTTQLGKAGRFLVFQIKLWSHCARLLKKNRSGQQAAALSYHTIFGMVPLAIVMLMIFQSFPAYSDIGDKIKNFIYEQANFTAFKSPTADDVDSEETVALTDHLDKLIADFFKETNKGQIGLFSVVFVIWAALLLLTTIEKSFNNIWHVARGRNFLQRIISYWALLTLGPLLLGAGIYVSTSYSAIGRLQKTILSNMAPVVLSYVVALVALFLLYYVLPNTKVKAKAAIWGAAVAALVWIGARNVFGLCITEFRLYSTVYGVLALIPMTVVWIYITWLTVLFGLQLTFTTQHLSTLDAAEIAAAKKTEEYFIANDLSVINLVREIAAAFQSDQAPVPLEVICSKLDVPAEFGEKMLDHLVGSRILLRTSEPIEGFVPARDPANVKLSDIAEAVATASIAQLPPGQSDTMHQVVQSQRSTLAQYSLKQILDANANPQDS